MKKIVISTAIILSSISLNCFADFYVGAQSGYAWIQTPNETLDNYVSPQSGYAITSQSSSIGNLAGGIFAGYKQPVGKHLKLGVEIGYNYNGSSDYYTYTMNILGQTNMSILSVSSEDIYTLLTATVAFNQKWDGFVKAGTARITQETNTSKIFSFNPYGIPTNTAPTSSTRIQTEPMFEIGAGYNVLPQLNLSLRYIHINGKNYSNFSQFNGIIDGKGLDVAAVDAVEFAAAYHF